MTALGSATCSSLGARLAGASTNLRSTRRSLSRRPRPRGRVLAAASTDESAGIQLGTAKLPVNVDEQVFTSMMFQWANTLTTSGQNMPLALPVRVDPQPAGFSMAFLMSDPKGTPGTFVSVGEIVANVEDAPTGGGVRVFMIRGTGKVAKQGALIDVPVIMQTMPSAIKNAIIGSTKGA